MLGVTLYLRSAPRSAELQVAGALGAVERLTQHVWRELQVPLRRDPKTLELTRGRDPVDVVLTR